MRENQSVTDLSRTALTLIAIAFLFLAGDAALAHWSALAGDNPDWRQWIAPLLALTAAVTVFAGVLRPSDRMYDLVSMIMAASAITGGIGMFLHLAHKLSRLSLDALRSQPTLGGPGVFLLLGAFGWLFVSALRAEQIEELKIAFPGGVVKEFKRAA